MAIDPILAVSDVHIGFQPESAERFAHFLEWVKDGLTPKGLPIETSQGVQNLRAPNTIILIGDFLDMWAPRNADYASPVEDGYRILDALFHLPCDKIYVPGNHDDVAARYVRDYSGQNKRQFTVVPKYYPQSEDVRQIPVDYPVSQQVRSAVPKQPPKVKQGVPIGKASYFFLHGHQFSKVWSVPVLKFFDFIGRVSYEAYEVSPGALLVGIVVLVFSVLLGIYSAIFPSWLGLLGQLPALASALLAIVWVALGVLGSMWIWRKFQTTYLQIHYEPAHGPRFAESAAFNRLIGRPKYRTIKELINMHYYKQGKDSINADVIVFGHTHTPELYTADTPGAYIRDTKKKGFVNTGAWVMSYSYSEQKYRPRDTFVYIDEKGPQLLQWHDETHTASEFID
jgi:UDP-2,3-diacylglucosamine pyrophosphatase LpxH